MSLTVWRLYVDEAGDFADADDAVCVGGLLLANDLPGSAPAAIRRRLEEAAPGFPWPLHATLLNLPVSSALAVLASSPHDTGQDVAAIAVALRREAPATLDRVLAGWDVERGVRYDDVRTLDTIAKRACPTSHQRMFARMMTAWTAVRLLIQGLTAQPTPCPFAVAVVTAGETSQGDAGRRVPAGSDFQTTRYLTVLRVFLARVHDVVARCRGVQEIRIQVLERGIRDPRRHGRVRFDERHLRTIVDETRRSGRTHVEMVVDRVAGFDRVVHPALVLADMTANAARHALRSFDRPLERVERHIVRKLAGATRSGNPPLSHLAASGRATAYVERARRGESPPDPAWILAEPRSYLWTAEQACEWATFVASKVPA